MREWKYYVALIVFLTMVLSWVAFNQGVDGSNNPETDEVIPAVANQSVIAAPAPASSEIQKPQVEQTDSEALPDDVGSSQNVSSTQGNAETNRKPAPGVVRKRAGQVGRIFKKIVRLGQ